MFNPNQHKFLFNFTRAAANGAFKGRNEEIKFFCKQLSYVIKKKDQRTAEALFQEAAEQFGVAYVGG